MDNSPAKDFITKDGKDYQRVTEGLATILVPKSVGRTSPDNNAPGETEQQSVFYNPIQQFNRDLSVLVIKAYGEERYAEKKQKWERKREELAKKRAQGGRKRKRGAVEEHMSEEQQQRRPIQPMLSGDTTSFVSDDLIGMTDTGTGSTSQDGEPKAQTATSVQAQQVACTDPSSQISENGRNVEESGPQVVNQEGGTNVLDIVARAQNPEDKVATEKKDFNSKDTGISAREGAEDARPADFTQTKAPEQFVTQLRILDALSATGLRAIRYVKELPFDTFITANDLSANSVKAIKQSVEYNGVEDKIEVTTNNALALMYSTVWEGNNRKKYEVIDLDPYGTAAPFFDAALQALQDGGLLCVTCTDPGVFASVSYPEKAYSLYGGISLKGPHSHEGGLRLLLHAIATSAARYGLAIEPLLSLSIDYYARLFVRVRRSPAEVKFLAGKTMVVYNCDQGCGAWKTQLLARHKETQNRKGGIQYRHSLAQAPSTGEFCEHCGFKTHLAGPFYAGPLHSSNFIQRLLNQLPDANPETYPTLKRIEGMLTTALEEDLDVTSTPSEGPLPTGTSEPTPTTTTTTTTKTKTTEQPPPPTHPATIDHHPFFFILNNLARVLHCVTPTEQAFRGALKHLGYRVTRSHCKRGSIKTDAPWSVIWHVMREWVRQRAPVKEGSVKEGMAGWKILKGPEGKREGTAEEKKRVEVGKGGGGVATENGEGKQKNATGEEDGDERNGAGGDVVEAEASSLDNNKEGNQGENAAGSKDAGTGLPKVVFDERLGALNQTKRILRYQMNPKPNWGPMTKAKHTPG